MAGGGGVGGWVESNPPKKTQNPTVQPKSFSMGKLPHILVSH